MKHNLISRFCSLFLALTLTVSLAVPAFAADGDSGASSGAGSASTELTGFSISLPTTCSITLGEFGTLTPEVKALPEGTSPSDITWTYETKGINSDTVPFTYTTGENGTVILNPTTVGSAHLTMRATVGDRTATAECLVQVVYAPARAITVLPTSGVVLDVNKTQILSAYLTPSATTDPTNVKWSSSNTDVVQLSSTVGQQIVLTATNPGITAITAYSGNESVSTTCDVTVRGLVVSAESPSMMVGKTQQLTATPYETDSESVKWSSGNESVAIVNSATGVVTALGVGSAAITATAGSYSSTYYISVTENTAASIKLNIEAGQPISFADVLSDKLNSVCLSMLSSPLDYITNLTVTTDEGTLYYGYATEASTGLGVGVTEFYHYSANAALGERALDDITFIPHTGFVGTATIYYTARSTTGATFSGQIALYVASSGDVVYTTPSNTPVRLMVTDFIDVCRAQTSGSLSYVTFTQPSSGRGTLYYKYSETSLYSQPVTADTKYRVSGSLQLSDITFVPAENYTGTVVIGYTAVSTAGVSYSGNLTITVTGDTASWDEITYRVSENGIVTFKAADFNRACIAAGGSTLSYVRFILPDSEDGTLYFDYISNRNYDSLVSFSTRYYYKNDPSISDITFIAEGELEEDIFIDFVAYDTRGNRYFCKVCIEPASSSSGVSSPATLSYNAMAGHFVTFNAEDFNEVSLDCTGAPLSHVKFELPVASRGTLYYNYNGTSPTKVSAASVYYRNSSLSKIAFVPKSTFSGTLSINYVGYTTTGTTFGGVIRVTVSKGKDLTIVRTTASGGSVPLSETDFNAVCSALTGETLNYVRFTLPASNCGTLYYGYNSATGKYSTKVTSGTNYYHTAKGTYKTIDKVSFLSNTSYTGTVDIPFTGWSNSSGTKITGTLRIIVTEPTADAVRYTGTSLPLTLHSADFEAVCENLMGRKLNYIRFTSLPDQNFGRLYLNYTSPSQPGTAVTTSQTYYANGTPALSNITFVPKAGYEGTITLYYTGKDSAGTGFSGTVSLTISNNGCVSSYSDMGNYPASIPAVEFLSNYDIITGNGQGQFNPNGVLCRGDFALMVCRAFGFNTGSRVSFSDVPENSYYAWAIATLKDLGIVQGDGILFCPKNPLSKEDAITLLYRAINVAGIELDTASAYLLAYYADGNQVSSYARQAVSTLLASGIATADELNQIYPQHPIRRAELAVMIHRVLTH